MTTASAAYEICKARLLANKPAGLTAYRWQNEEADSAGNPELPDQPAAFAYFELVTDRGQIASFGGGRGANIYRNPAQLIGFVFIPKGKGLKPATDIAEQLAALFRSYRDSDISCFDASVFPGGDGALLKPPGLNSEVGNYFWAGVEVSLFFDQVG